MTQDPDASHSKGRRLLAFDPSASPVRIEQVPDATGRVWIEEHFADGSVRCNKYFEAPTAPGADDAFAKPFIDIGCSVEVTHSGYDTEIHFRSHGFDVRVNHQNASVCRARAHAIVKAIRETTR